MSSPDSLAPPEAEAITHPDTPSNAPPHKRTVGMRVFDTIVYPIFNNVGVFALSVYATYKTNFGADGNFLKNRAIWVNENIVEKLKVGKGTARMGIMVFFSFLDGCLLAPFVTLFERDRNPISHAIDNALGTTPADTSVYDTEPKQGWRSILGGRAATAAIVVPVAVVLSKGTQKGVKDSLNDKLFTHPGIRLGEWVEKSFPALKKALPELNFKGAGEIALFEGFYTTVCTGGLYESSRIFARHINKHDAAKAHDATIESAPLAESGVLSSQNGPKIPANSNLPDSKITRAISLGPVANDNALGHSRGLLIV